MIGQQTNKDNADSNVDGGAVGEPLKSAGFYDPNAVNYRDNNSPVNLNRPQSTPNDPTTFSYPAGYNPADPPQTLSRAKRPGAPPVGVGSWPSDSDLITAPTWEAFRDLMYGDEIPPFNKPKGAHGAAHGYIGGNLTDALDYASAAWYDGRRELGYLLHELFDADTI